MPSSYPIRAVAKLTGIPEDTLRAWERRYGAVIPRRSGRGRLYSDKEIQRLVLLRDAVAQGHSIGQIASVSNDQLRILLRKSADLAMEKVSGRETVPKRNATDENKSLQGVLAAIGAYDYSVAERELNRLAAATPSPRELVHRVAFPLMRITGERWHEGKFTIAQEHMLTSLLSGLFASMLRLYAPANPRARVLMATPENEHHGFAILAAAMLTAAGGLGAIHLGTNLPTRDILEAARKTEADAILLGLCAAEPHAVIPVLREIQSRAIPRTQLWVGGASAPIAGVAAELGWTLLKDFSVLERQLGLLGARF
jgi:DNA-binding transcriptional MerR regulator/methylmalonyl-CoA mutase cobalamin-binding subunit